MKTGVVVGRWQIDSPHSGHLFLLDHVREIANKLVIVIGFSPLSFTNINPLDFEIRRAMLKSEYPEADILGLMDAESDKDWSNNLDSLLLNNNYEDVVLFGGRDSFIPRYSGKFLTTALGEFSINKLSSTDKRKLISKRKIDSPTFRAGIIYTVENKFPTAYPTVDIAVLRLHDSKTSILLGKKPNKTKYCFIGGFVDPSDTCLESAASRELREEVGNILTHEFKYVGSKKINDYRYESTKDGIITSLFMTYMMGGNPVASDDIEEIKWFDLEDFDINVLSDHHKPLFDMLSSYIGSKKFKVEVFD